MVQCWLHIWNIFKVSGTGPLSERIYQGDDDQWYYRTRGNQSAGPFPDHNSAEQALKDQISAWAPQPKAAWSRHFQPSKIFRRSATRQS